MADRRATNKYYPPEWDPSKGSINTFVGQHPLRERARKLDQGILIVRFELPFNVWCEGCEKHIGMGVRYNAEKKKIGMYYSTPILSFRMKCHLCSHWIEIHTDPKNAEYIIISGARKREEGYDPADIGLPTLQSESTTEKIATDAFYKLEHQVADTKRASAVAVSMSQLIEYNDNKWKDPYAMSQKLRKGFRTEKKEMEKVQAEGKLIADRLGLKLVILPAAKEDDVQAKAISWDKEPETVAEKAARVHASSVFAYALPAKRRKASVSSQSSQSASMSSLPTPLRLSSANPAFKPTSKSASKPDSKTASKTVSNRGKMLITRSRAKPFAVSAPSTVKKPPPAVPEGLIRRKHPEQTAAVQKPAAGLLSVADYGDSDDDNDCA
ncbi:hypothetical protein HDU87_008391 [Geranomyces variabilis]|uniref:DUF572-domain-containing protein n=1 Tax=Geranomyces variabilis TaxID=109894 RepID=A0AAD5XJ35_9FUNG|nr:hypothetical protein HDU87_008391 [Geranomyces variabilis]